jgi:magnesium-transporting ATPase (P-type)
MERVSERSGGPQPAGARPDVQGLTAEEARRRADAVGPNEIFRPEPISFLGILREEITEPMILLVLAEVGTEYRAKVAISSLEKLSAIKTRVVRSGRIVEIDTLEVVPTSWSCRRAPRSTPTRGSNAPSCCRPMSRR